MFGVDGIELVCCVMEVDLVFKIMFIIGFVVVVFNLGFGVLINVKVLFKFFYLCELVDEVVWVMVV